MTKLNDIYNSYGKSFSTIVANTYSGNILSSLSLPESSLIIASPYDRESEEDVGPHSLIVTDFEGSPVRLTYDIQEGNGLNFRDDSIGLDIDGTTIVEEDGVIKATLASIVDNRTMTVAGNTVKANPEMLDKASASVLGLAKVDGTTMKSSNGVITVDTSSLDYATDTLAGIIKPDSNTVASSSGVLSVNSSALSRGSNSTYGMLKVDGSTLKSSNGTVYATHESFKDLRSGDNRLVKADGITLTQSNGVISVNEDSIPYASTSTIGKVRLDQSSVTIDSNGKVHPKNYEESFAYIYDYGEALDTIDERIGELESLVDSGLSSAEPEIYSLSCNETNTTALTIPEHLEQTINMPVQHVYVSLNVVTNCDFNIAIKYDTNEPPAVELQDINYNDEIKKVGNEAIEYTWPSTRMKEKHMIFLFNAKNFYSSVLGKTLTTKIIITFGPVKDQSASKEIVCSIVRYNSIYKLDEIEQSIVETETIDVSSTFIPIESSSYWIVYNASNAVVWTNNPASQDASQYKEYISRAMIDEILSASYKVNFYGEFYDTETGKTNSFTEENINVNLFSSQYAVETRTIEDIPVKIAKYTLIHKADFDDIFYYILYECAEVGKVYIDWSGINNGTVRMYAYHDALMYNIYQHKLDEYATAVNAKYIDNESGTYKWNSLIKNTYIFGTQTASTIDSAFSGSPASNDTTYLFSSGSGNGKKGICFTTSMPEGETQNCQKAYAYFINNNASTLYAYFVPVSLIEKYGSSLSIEHIENSKAKGNTHYVVLSYTPLEFSIGNPIMNVTSVHNGSTTFNMSNLDYSMKEESTTAPVTFENPEFTKILTLKLTIKQNAAVIHETIIDDSTDLSFTMPSITPTNLTYDLAVQPCKDHLGPANVKTGQLSTTVEYRSNPRIEEGGLSTVRVGNDFFFTYEDPIVLGIGNNSGALLNQQFIPTNGLLEIYANYEEILTPHPEYLDNGNYRLSPDNGLETHLTYIDISGSNPTVSSTHILNDTVEFHPNSSTMLVAYNVNGNNISDIKAHYIHNINVDTITFNHELSKITGSNDALSIMSYVSGAFSSKGTTYVNLGQTFPIPGGAAFHSPSGILPTYCCTYNDKIKMTGDLSTNKKVTLLDFKFCDDGETANISNTNNVATMEFPANSLVAEGTQASINNVLFAYQVFNDNGINQNVSFRLASQGSVNTLSMTGVAQDSLFMCYSYSNADGNTLLGISKKYMYLMAGRKIKNVSRAFSLLMGVPVYLINSFVLDDNINSLYVPEAIKSKFTQNIRIGQTDDGQVELSSIWIKFKKDPETYLKITLDSSNDLLYAEEGESGGSDVEEFECTSYFIVTDSNDISAPGPKVTVNIKKISNYYNKNSFVTDSCINAYSVAYNGCIFKNFDPYLYDFDTFKRCQYNTFGSEEFKARYMNDIIVALPFTYNSTTDIASDHVPIYVNDDYGINLTYDAIVMDSKVMITRSDGDCVEIQTQYSDHIREIAGIQNNSSSSTYCIFPLVDGTHIAVNGMTISSYNIYMFNDSNKSYWQYFPSTQKWGLRKKSGSSFSISDPQPSEVSFGTMMSSNEYTIIPTN